MSLTTDIFQLFQNSYGFKPKDIIPLTPEGSQREYYRILYTTPEGKQDSLIGVLGTVVDENKAFIHISKCLNEQDVKLPKITAVTNDLLTYLQEDFGDISLFSLIKEKGFTNSIINLIKGTFEELVKFQLRGLNSVDTHYCYPVKEMDQASISWDLNYFKYCFLKLHNIDIDEVVLEVEFKRLISKILACEPWVLVHRDFQSRNIMVKDDTPVIIDFQGARLGPALYDPVSFLWQTRISMPDEIKENLMDYYIDILKKESPDKVSIDRNNVLTIVIFRMLQVLGAYGFRGLIQGKAKFREPIPDAIDNLINTIEKIDPEFLYLKELLLKCQEQYKTISYSSPAGNKNPLTVDITSFSFKKGYPVDDSGNGGGFVFDCRSINNPGRYEEYKNLTGYDQIVKDFFRLNSNIDLFLKDCYQLVDRTVEVYIKRGFNHLSVSFGCTGGRHRSLFSANALAQHLHEKYPVLVRVNHREQNIQYTLSPLS